MEALLGKVNSIEGKFFAEDANGNVIELKNGDEITQGVTVFGDPGNSASAMISVAMEDGSEIINISGSSRQLFDNSLVNEVNDEKGILSALEENETTDKQDEAVYDETAAGEENVDGSGDSSGVFATRDGSATDISAGLRDAQFFTDENRVEGDGILLDNGITLEEVIEPNEEPDTVPTAPVLSMNVDLDQEPSTFTAYAFNGDNFMTGNGQGTLGTLKLDSPNGELIYHNLGLGVEENVHGHGRSGTTDLGVEDNETIVFDLGSSVNSVTFTLKSDGTTPFNGSWKAFDSDGKEIANANDKFTFLNDDTITIDTVLGGFQYIAIDGHDYTLAGQVPGGPGASGPGFYVNVDSIGDISTSDYEYTISLDADLAGSSDIPGDLTDVTLSDLPDGVTLHDSLGAEITPVAGVYTVAIDADGKADVTLTSPDLLESTEIDVIDSSVSTTDGYMSVTDSQSDATTLSVSNGSIDFSSLVDDHESLENIDLDNSTNQVASISLDDVLDMTDSSNELSIAGNVGDTLSVETDGWSETGVTADNTYTYVHDLSGDSITLIVDDVIDVIAV